MGENTPPIRGSTTPTNQEPPTGQPTDQLAHKQRQTDLFWAESRTPGTRAHLSATWRKHTPRGAKTRSADLEGRPTQSWAHSGWASTCAVQNHSQRRWRLSHWKYLPGNRPLEAIKGGPHTPLQHTLKKQSLTLSSLVFLSLVEFRLELSYSLVPSLLPRLGLVLFPSSFVRLYSSYEYSLSI